MNNDVFKVFYCYKPDCNTQQVSFKTTSMQQLKLVQLRLAKKALASIELLVKAMRHTGPFGGAPIDQINIKALLKEASFDGASIRPHTIGHTPYYNSSKVVKVFFEDKYEKMKRILVEQFVVEVMEIPDSMHGFECVSHPHLENEKALSKFFDAWLNTTLKSIYYLLECSPLAAYFLNPCSSEEREVANELRKRYNLIVDTTNSEPNIRAELPKPDKSLELLVKSKQYLNKLLVKMKVLNLQNYKGIIEDLRGYRHSSESKISNPNRESNSMDTPQWQERTRFFSDNRFPEGSFSPSNKVTSFSRHQMSEKDDSLDLSSSSRHSNTRPFKLQESYIDDRMQQHKRRISSDSVVSLMLKQADSHILDLQGEMGMIDYMLDQHDADSRESTAGHKIADNHSGSSSKLDGSKHSSRNRSIHSGSQVGLASIASHLLRSGTITDECLELDEDDRLIELCEKNIYAREEAFLIARTLTPALIPIIGKYPENARIVVNLPVRDSRSIKQDLTFGQWIDELSNSSNQI